MSGKGSSRRGDALARKKYEENYARIFTPALKEYPGVCCAACAVKYGGRMRHDYATWHEGICPVCNTHQCLTEPRDFGYPDFCRTKKASPR